jgi:hypothetical protein
LLDDGLQVCEVRFRSGSAAFTLPLPPVEVVALFSSVRKEGECLLGWQAGALSLKLLEVFPF